MPDDLYEMITKMEAEFSALHSRMDTDKALYHLEPFILKGKDGRALPGVENLTINEPQTYAVRAVAILLGATMQMVVEGEGLDDNRTTTIEDFHDAILEAADERISNRGLIGLHPFVCEHILLRGHIAARPVISMKGDDFIADILPMDCRYLTYEAGPDGIKWFSYQTRRTGQQIEEEYGIHASIAANNEYTIRDYWNDKENVVFAEKEIIKEQDHKLGYPPIVKTEATCGSLLMDSDAAQWRGESIYASNRDLYQEASKLVTVLNTLNMMSFRAPMQKEEEDLNAATRPEDPYGTAVVIPVKKGNLYTSMPHQDIRQATRLLHSVISQMIQRGGLPNIDYGSLAFPLSAVAISRLTSAKDQVFAPRLQALALFYQQLAKMIIEQYMAKKIRVKLGEPGKAIKYKPTDLKGDYTIKFQFASTSPEQNIANYSIAEAASPWLSQDTIRRDVIRMADPDAETRKREVEAARRRSPILTQYNAVKALIEEDHDIEARLLAQELRLNVKQLLSGNMPQPEPEPERGGGQPLAQLMGGPRGGGAGKSSNQEAAEMDVEDQAE